LHFKLCFWGQKPFADLFIGLKSVFVHLFICLKSVFVLLFISLKSVFDHLFICLKSVFVHIFIRLKSVFVHLFICFLSTVHVLSELHGFQNTVNLSDNSFIGRILFLTHYTGADLWGDLRWPWKPPNKEQTTNMASPF